MSGYSSPYGGATYGSGVVSGGSGTGGGGTGPAWIALWGGIYPGFNAYPRGVPSSDVVGVPTVKSISQVRLVTERAPLRLSMNIQTPAGYETRWSVAETNPLKTHQGLTFSTTLPGGFEHCDVTLIRDPRRSFFDLVELQRITIYGAGGSVAWQGRLETIPSVSGDQLSLTPGAVGYQSALTDDNSARELFVENDLTKWQGPFLNRQLRVASLSAPFDIEGGVVAPNPADPGNAYVPALVTQFSGSWTRQHDCESWYDTQGIPIGYFLWNAMVAQVTKIGDGLTDANNGWIFNAGICRDDAIATSPDGVHWTDDTAGVQYDDSGNFSSLGTNVWSGRIPASGFASSRFYAFVQSFNTYNLPGGGTFGGTDGVIYPLYWRTLTLIGNQVTAAFPTGLPLYDSDESAPITGGGVAHAPVKGVLGSDVLKFAVPKYAPEIAITNQGISTIQASSFVIPELVFLTPGTVSDIIKAVSAFELQDWGVWEGDLGPTFYWNPRNSTGRRWRSRMGPANLQSTGPQIDRLFNGVIVNFTDFSGIARTVGPGGAGVPSWAQSGCTYQDPSLIDLDPENPLNQWGQQIRKWAPLTMSSTSTLAQAVAIGVVFLDEQKLRNSSGSAQLNGYVEDDLGITWPAWMVRAGDSIAFIDAAESGYRRIVSTSYNDDTHINSITLDSPPDTLQAILSRLQVTLVPITGG